MKIATCCFCGSTTALKLEAGRHELSCGNCGAPLRDLKRLPKEPRARKVKPAVSHAPPPRRFEDAPKPKRAKPRKWKKRKSWLKEIAEEVFDIVEDIFD